MDIAKKPTPIPTPLYPDPNAPKVPTGLQGPNEQSIVASGMTVEEWQRKHPRTPLGPTPEDVGQVTTDPPDGSVPEPPYPGTGTTADPELMSLEKDAPIEDLEPVGSTSVEVDPVPVPEEPKSYPELVETTENDDGIEGTEDDTLEDDHPWDSMARHADIDAYANDNGVVLPHDWSTMTIQEKRGFLTDWGSS